eukprot:CAMPEP_0113320480 /NCGR_PEP_ID=MMETSP0010_2-20120614/14286_1 /TAXON_ID=216773 ORGANISM="Corethron hystrix, Strain 308" /NCGR_SAMPLE_ID=MMETSP0010_2 /ASSEMBLY_ACC=CAM_ASM_000155 /LENGTH=93 /DNA_ID=CAMNT_0000178299 /DNA_START=33 /DNA_END=317 /DNA_ORIENTATION=+ /assembly_acc=CAM_ASM_000155
MSLLQELGMSDITDPLNANVSHNIVLNLSPAFEAAIIRSVLPWFIRTGHTIGRAVTILSFAIAGRLMCSGVARLIEASKRPPPAYDDRSHDKI